MIQFQENTQTDCRKGRNDPISQDPSRYYWGSTKCSCSRLAFKSQTQSMMFVQPKLIASQSACKKISSISTLVQQILGSHELNSHALFDLVHPIRLAENILAHISGTKIFHFPNIWGKTCFLKNPALSCTTPDEFLAPSQNLEKTKTKIPRKHLNRRMDRRTDRPYFIELFPTIYIYICIYIYVYKLVNY